MDPTSILAICLSSISALASILTIGFVGYKISFGDRQDTSLNVISKIYHPVSGVLVAEKTIDFMAANLEQFKTESVKFKNGKQEVTATNLKTPINIDSTVNDKGKGILSEDTHLTVDNTPATNVTLRRKTGDQTSNDEVIEISDFQAMLENNSNGDREISEARQNTFYIATVAFIQGINLDYNFLGEYLKTESDVL
jgi:hypothetical protein